jgi:hypothetical protein
MTQGVDSVRPSWKRHAVVALIAFVGTQVASTSAWLAMSALGSLAAFLVSLIVIGICGWVTTRLGRLPFRLALVVAGLLFAVSVLISWSGEAEVNHVRFALLNATSSAAFAVGAWAGARRLRNRTAG